MIIAILFFVTLASIPTPVVAVRESILTTSGVYWFSDNSQVSGAISHISTNEWGARATLSTSGLTPNDVVTLWWVIFNHPEHCEHGTGEIRCGEGDLFVPEVEASVQYAAGKRVTGGSAFFTSFSSTDDTSGAILGDWGLHHPLSADIHLVVRSHGQLIPELLGSQLTTFGGGCNNVPEGTGEPGPNTCVDLQYAVHEQVE